MDYHQITLSEWLTAKEELRKALQDTKTAFVRTGYWLRKIEDGKLFEQEERGFKSVAEYAEAEYNISSSTCSRLMAINRQFSTDGYSLELAEPYRGFSFGLLVEMKDISEEGRAMITPETPREDIREIRRYEREAGTIVEEAPKSPDYHPAIRAFLESLEEKELSAQAAAAAKGPKAVLEEVAPSGRRLFRHGVYLVNFTERCITIRKFGQGDEMVSWEEYSDAILLFSEERKETDGYSGGTEEENDKTSPSGPGEVREEVGESADGSGETKKAGEEDDGGEETEETESEEEENAGASGEADGKRHEPGNRRETEGSGAETGENAGHGSAQDGSRKSEGDAGSGSSGRTENVRTDDIEEIMPKPADDPEPAGTENSPENAGEPIAPAQFDGEKDRDEALESPEEFDGEPEKLGKETDGAAAILAASDLERAAARVKQRDWKTAYAILKRVELWIKNRMEE